MGWGCEVCSNCSDPDCCGGCVCPVLGDNCRTGCKTLDHYSYAECLQSASIQIGNLK